MSGKFSKYIVGMNLIESESIASNRKKKPARNPKALANLSFVATKIDANISNTDPHPRSK